MPRSKRIPACAGMTTATGMTVVSVLSQSNRPQPRHPRERGDPFSAEGMELEGNAKVKMDSRMRGNGDSDGHDSSVGTIAK